MNRVLTAVTAIAILVAGALAIRVFLDGSTIADLRHRVAESQVACSPQMRAAAQAISDSGKGILRAVKDPKSMPGIMK